MSELAPPTGADGLDIVHVGGFSGSALSLRDELARQVPVRSVDLMTLTRRPSLLRARMQAVREAGRAGRGVPWTKTAAWSSAVQTHVARHGFLTRTRPLLVVQTLPALVPAPGTRYAVYTDRVSLEREAAGRPDVSDCAPGWVERESALLRGASRIFVMGPSTQHALVDRYGLRADRVEVVGGGPNSRLGPPRPRRECRRLLFVGVDWERKGGPTLLQAFARLRRRHPHLELDVVGGGPPGDLPAGVCRLGRLPHDRLEAVFDNAEVLVLPTREEAFGLVLVEALIKGLPCVHSTVGNQGWIVGRAGEAAPPDDVGALTDALGRVVEGYAGYHERALQRGAVLRTSMSWPAIAGRITDHLLG